MAVFTSIYQKVIAYSQQKSAPYVLAGLSFFESFILPFPPPDVLLAPMSLAQPEKALKFAGITLAASILGGLTGYAIGAFLFETVEPFIIDWGYQTAFNRVMSWFEVWGFWAVLIAGFSPVPYKLFTLSAGLLGLALIPFLVASIIGRGARFYLVAWMLARFGPGVEAKLLQSIEKIGWAIVIILTIVIGLYYGLPD
ncbi:MAG: membrane protein YqaA with SNARE-associated domain [Gammaproteobacteria bacterium]|jgi:membrane protein YqaA with SNARE-associated domain